MSFVYFYVILRAQIFSYYTTIDATVYLRPRITLLRAFITRLLLQYDGVGFPSHCMSSYLLVKCALALMSHNLAREQCSI